MLILEYQGSLVKATRVNNDPKQKKRHDWKRGEVLTFSAKSRKRLLEQCARLEAKHMTHITLTYRDNFQDAAEAKRHLDVFFKRVFRRFPKASAIWRMEYQKRGAIHFHILLFNMPYWNKDGLTQAWHECSDREGGYTFIEFIRNKKHMFSYVGKYLAKTEQSDAPHGEVSLSMCHTSPKWQGRVWGVRNRDHLPYAQKTVQYWYNRPYKVGAALKRLARRHYSRINKHPHVGFSLFVDDSSQWCRCFNSEAARVTVNYDPYGVTIGV